MDRRKGMDAKKEISKEMTPQKVKRNDQEEERIEDQTAKLCKNPLGTQWKGINEKQTMDKITEKIILIRRQN